VRRSLAILVLLGVVAGSACDSDEELFPRTGTLTLQILDRTLAGQTSEEPTNQFEKWTVRVAEVDVSGQGPLNFLGVPPPCEVGQRLSGLGSNCRINGLVLDPGTASTLKVRVVVGQLEVIRALRPVLTAGGDFDGDTILDDDDNCIYIANTDQANENAAEEGENPVGDACTTTGGAKDSDGDNVADIFDNCVYLANPTQADAPRGDGFFDGVGDLCEEKVEVRIPLTGVEVGATDLAFTIREQALTVITVDFQSKEWCGQGATSCTLDPQDVTVAVQ
jgi:hypothetical protein